MVRFGAVMLLVLLACFLPAASQDSPAAAAPSAQGSSPISGAPAQSGAPMPAASLTLNDVIDRVVQREHLFLAQMRHLHPLVETYLQDLKNDGSGNPVPVNDKYFLGRLDMFEGPEDTSFVGQPGFGHRLVTKLTGIYSLHFLPLGCTSMTRQRTSPRNSRRMKLKL